MPSETAIYEWLWAVPGKVWWTLRYFPWHHALDVGVMTVFVYQIYIRLLGTKAMRIVAGLVVLGIGYLGAQAVGMFLVSWLLGGMWAASLVFVIVIFQSDIRHMMGQINVRLPATILWRWARWVRLPEERLTAVVEAIFRLAAGRHGAIVVFERDDPLEPLLKSLGTVVDAQVSPELLETVFAFPTALHDGALYIRGGRAYRAGCVLPLSENPRLAYYYGTRHRAALGISEQSDALAVVVSEERGKVSVVEHGTITVADNTTELLDWLTEHLTTPEEKPKRSRAVKAFFTHNWRPKLATLAAVGLLWFVLVGQQNAELGFSIPVVYTNVPKELTIEGRRVHEVFVSVRGSRERLNFLDHTGLQIAIDLKEASEGRQRYTIHPEDIKLPPGLQLSSVSPPVLELRLGKKPPEPKNNKR